MISPTQHTASAERIVRANGVDLCVQTFGNPADPASRDVAVDAILRHTST